MSDFVEGLTIKGEMGPTYEALLTPQVQRLLVDLHRRYESERQALLREREHRQAALDAGEKPDFLAETRHIREDDWTIAGTPPDLQDRRVEITGPTDAKMVINALNSGARVFMADFEDANTPTWANMMDGQNNLAQAVRRTLAFTDPGSGKAYALSDTPAVLKVRPRGWHLDERHVLVDGQPMAGGVFDVAVYLANNARELVSRGSGPYFYLPKMEGHREAALWDQVFRTAQAALDLPVGTVKATVLIEHILAAFEADEILHALKDHIVGLNCGRWDYIFSYVKVFRNDPSALLPDRSLVTMTVPFMRAYSLYVIKTCHRRGAHAIGGMAANIPVKNDEAANADAFAKVKADKEREAGDGHDGTWVAHPGLVPVALEAFNAVMPEANQVARQRDDIRVSAADLIERPEGPITEKGVRANLIVGTRYIEAWLRGRGAVPLYNLMEDAATAEISRAQLWQWLRHGATLEDGRTVTRQMIHTCLDEELAKVRDEMGAATFDGMRHEDAKRLLLSLVEADQLAPFLTLSAYDQILREGK